MNDSTGLSLAGAITALAAEKRAVGYKYDAATNTFPMTTAKPVRAVRSFRVARPFSATRIIPSRGLVKVYERWLKTRSPRSGQMLAERGGVPNPSIKFGRIQ